MVSIRSDLVGSVHLPGGMCLCAGDPIPPGVVVGAHLIEDGDVIEPVVLEEIAPVVEPVVIEEPAAVVEPIVIEGVIALVPEEPAAVAEPVETAKPATTTSRTRRRSNGRAR